MRKCVSTVLFENLHARRFRPLSYYADEIASYFDWFGCVYPDYDLCMCTDPRVEEHILLPSFVRAHYEPLNDMSKARALLHRARPIWFGKYDYVFTDDLDAVPCPRVAEAREAFIASDCDVHAVRDSPKHEIEMLGGLYGVDVAAARAHCGYATFADFLAAGPDIDDMEHAQAFQRETFWRTGRKRMAHVGPGSPEYDEEVRLALEISTKHELLDRSIPVAGGSFGEMRI